MVQQKISEMPTSSCTSQLQEEAREVQKRKKKKRSGSTLVASHFLDLYKLTGEVLGKGSCGSVQVCRSIFTSEEYAVKIIEKTPSLCRSNVFKEIEMMHRCQGHSTIIQLVEYFEEEDNFYLVFEKVNGGTLLSRLHKNFRLTESDASMIMRDLASALDFLHQKGIAHRDIKLDNILCVYPDQLYPVKVCDFDLASDAEITYGAESITTSDLYTPVGTAEYMAPEVVRGYRGVENVPYDKHCDLWSLGVCLYLMLCGYHPFSGDCGNENCEWDLGGDCEACQELLFSNITNCLFEFPEEEWAEISEDAKNLIRHLLIEEPCKRLSANKICNHQWIVSGGIQIQDINQDESLDSICDLPSDFDLNLTWLARCTPSREDSWQIQTSDEVKFNNSESQDGAFQNLIKNMESQVNHPDDAGKIPLESRISVENMHDHSEHKSWRRAAKIVLKDEIDQDIYFDTRMEMYEIMKERFDVGINEAQSVIDDLRLMERFQLFSPPTSRMAQRRFGRRRIQSPYHSSHLINTS